MNSKFHHVGLVGKYLHASATSNANGTPPEVLLSVAQILQACGCQVSIEAHTAAMTGLDQQFNALALEDIANQCDLCVVIGGDGTMLGAARQVAPKGVPLIGINQGRLGFITDISLGKIEQTLPAMLRGEYIQDHRSMVYSKVLRHNECVFDALAFNDVVINRGSTAGMVELRIEVDDHFVTNIRADGLIVSTATGSTAYSLSAGGPLLHPSVSGLIVVPIAPHSLSNRPIVLPDSGEIAIEIVAGRKASANFDTQSLSSLRPGDRVTVRRAVHQALFLHPVGWNYFDTLREKLHWNSGSN